MMVGIFKPKKWIHFEQVSAPCQRNPKTPLIIFYAKYLIKHSGYGAKVGSNILEGSGEIHC